MPEEREVGYYWVSTPEEPEIAFWDGDDWWMTGLDTPTLVPGDVLSDRLTPPK